MKLKPGFYMEDDGTIWLVYPDGRMFVQLCSLNVVWHWHSVITYKKYLLTAKKIYIGL